MPNIAKDIIIKSRDKMFAKLVKSIDDLNNRVDEIKHHQLNIDERNEYRYRDLSEMVRNSGILQVSQNEVVVKLFNGLKIYLDTRDISVTPHLALDSIWEYNITRAWIDVVKRHDVIIDIGANYGYFGILAAQQTDKKDSKVIFFEPNPELVPYIHKTLSVNWLNEQSVVENMAVADKPGKAKLNVLKDYVGSSSLHTAKHIDAFMHNKMKVETQAVVTVQAVSIDDYCTGHNIKQVDLIKMDIEGYEDKAYQGMRDIVKASPNLTMFIEFTRESYDNPGQFYQQMLDDFGYVYLIDRQGRLVLQDKTDYASVIGTPEDWVMPVFSKNNKLASNN